MRWSTVCGEIWSSAAISLDDRCSLTRRRQSSCPALSRAIRASISSPAELSSPSAVSGTRGHSSKANPTPNAMALLSTTSPALNLFHNGEVGQISADFRELCRKETGWGLFAALTPLAPRAVKVARQFLRTGCAREWWRGLDSNQRTLARADLQSAAFNHSATSPRGLPRADHPRDGRARRAGAPCGGAAAGCQRAPMTAVPCCRRSALRAPRAPKSNHPPDGRDFGAGEGNRTLVVSLEGFCSTIELHPPGPGRWDPWHCAARPVNRVRCPAARSALTVRTC